jgi:hypothetical protein
MKHAPTIQEKYMSVKKPTEKEIEAVIDQGGKVKEDLKKKKWIIINLRLQETMLQEVDAAVERRVGIARTGWILEAIHEKLKRGE